MATEKINSIIGNSSSYLAAVHKIATKIIGVSLFDDNSHIRNTHLLRGSETARYHIHTDTLVSEDYNINVTPGSASGEKIGDPVNVYLHENEPRNFLDKSDGLKGFSEKEEEVTPDLRINKGSLMRDHAFHNAIFNQGASFVPATENDYYSTDNFNTSVYADYSINKPTFTAWTKGNSSYSAEHEDLSGLGNKSDKMSSEAPIHYINYNELGSGERRDTKHITSETDSFDFNTGGSDYNRTHLSYNEILSLESTNDQSTLIGRTNTLFKTGKIGSIISRFKTGNQFGENAWATSRTEMNGMSRGRNLLKGKSESINGYDNPYCRVWTSHYQYSKINNLIRPFTKDGALVSAKDLHDYGKYNGMRTELAGSLLEDYSSLLSTGFPKIAPIKNPNSKSIDPYEIKKCMFSIENLAWKGQENKMIDKSSQLGPNGGRIMWFPPYNLKFNENVHVDWNSNEFIGRGEKIYTYRNTERSGTLSFTILVDHPSSVDLFVEHNQDSNEMYENEQKLLRYFAGCESDILEDGCSDVVKEADSGQTISVKTVLVPENIKVLFPVFYPNNFSCVDYSDDSIADGFEYIRVNYENTDRFPMFGEKYESLQYKYKQDDAYSGQILKEGNEYDSCTYGLNTHYFKDFLTGGTAYTEECTEQTLDEVKKTYEAAKNAIMKKASSDTKIIMLDELYKISGGTQDLFKILSDSGNTDGTDYEVESYESFGYASTQGYSNLNTTLSQNRANSIVRYLKKLGLVDTNTVDSDCDVISADNSDDNNTGSTRAIKCACVLVTYKPKTVDANEATKKSDGTTQTVNTNSKTVIVSGSSYYNMKETTTSGNCLNSDNFYNEYKFFDELSKETDSFYYKNLMSKLKYFTPAFHSITPEGFNARLTFLHQCTRQGPTESATDSNSSEETSYIGNMSFGTAPYCVLRIGDFFNTKILIDSLSIDYDVDGIKWDTNPEGIGIQPMMANVTLGIKFFGGSDITGPISRLQNAISSNYYANASIYDNNALHSKMYEKLVSKKTKSQEDLNNVTSSKTSYEGQIGTIKTNKVDAKNVLNNITFNRKSSDASEVSKTGLIK